MALSFPDSHHLSSAVGWLELGDSREALADLDRISPEFSNAPEVLEVKWAIYAKEEKWNLCVQTATELTKTEPNDAFGWVHLSFALHELKLTQAAYDNLKSVVEEFPKDWLIPYNMACYACQLGDLAQAGQLLAGAMVKGGKKEVKDMARQDPDLAPLFADEEE